MKRSVLAIVLCALTSSSAIAGITRQISGVVLDDQGGAVSGALVTAQFDSGKESTITDGSGKFRLQVPAGDVRLSVSGQFIYANQRPFSTTDPSDQVVLTITYKIPPAHESLVIRASALEPTIDRRNDAVYSKTLFGRDDQLLDTLAAGINAGQHEGGGKSLEIRRFGFNLDHGGVNGGLKVLVDDVSRIRPRRAMDKATWVP